MEKESAIGAILKEKCPRCRSGKMFKYKAYNLLHFAEMYERCPHCQLKYEVEPAFFIGAMYISYAISTAAVLTCFATIYILLNNPELWVYITVIVIVSFLIMPVNFRYSRVLMLYLFGGVDYAESLSK